METNYILTQLKSATEQLLEVGSCLIDANLTTPIANALADLGLPVCGGIYIPEDNLRCLYLNK